MGLDVLMKNPSLLKSAPYPQRVTNYLQFEFNLNLTHNTVQELVNHFDLILINERWNESLVLLKYTTCADWSSIKKYARSTMNLREYEKPKFTPEQATFIEENLITVDQEIY